MKKRLLLIAFVLTVLLCTACGCQMDLSHKHYVNNYGVCRQCQEDQSLVLTKNAQGEYLSGDLQLGTISDTIIRFVANGERGVTVAVECETSEIKDVTLYSKTSAYMCGGTSTLTWENELVAGQTYYLRLRMKQAGVTRVSVTPIAVTDCE